jgi:hypothetical protein
MLKVSYRAIKEVWIPMLPWINSIHRVHHRSSHEYLSVLTVPGRERAKPWSQPPIHRLVFVFKAVACSSIIDPWASVSYLDSLIVLSSVVFSFSSLTLVRVGVVSE